jgi:hypothetical protein
MTEPTIDNPIIKVPRGCSAAMDGIGCGCTGGCQELIEVVPAHLFWRVVGERDEARRQLDHGRVNAIPSTSRYLATCNPQRDSRGDVWCWTHRRDFSECQRIMKTKQQGEHL